MVIAREIAEGRQAAERDVASTQPSRDLMTGAVYVLAAVATVLAATPWLRAFPTSLALAVLLPAAIASVAIPPLGARLGGWPVPVTIGASALACVVFLLLGALRSPLAFGDLVAGFDRGLARLLSTQLPVSQPRWLLVVPVVLCWLAGAVASELLTRTRAVGLAVGCWLVAYPLAYAATVGGGGATVPWAVLLAAVCGALVLCRRLGERLASEGVIGEESAAHTSARSARAVRQLMVGLVTLVVVVAPAALVVPRVMQGAPVTPARMPPVVTVSPVSPTTAAAELRSAPWKATMVRVRTNRPASGYLAMAVLDDYDGDTWTFDSTFRPTGGTVPGPPARKLSARGPAVVQQYTIERSPRMPWMPFVERPSTVSGIDVDFAASSGMVMPTSPLSRGERYSVVSKASAKTLFSLTPAELERPIRTSPEPSDYAVPPGAGPSLSAAETQLQRETGLAPTPTLGYLQAVLNDFRNNYRRLSATTGSAGGARIDYGTSLANVEQAVMQTRKATPEQFATMFAMVARHLGIPARLVTGYRVTPPASRPHAMRAGATYAVTNREAWTWVELPVAGLGWVVADPTPSATGAPPAPTIKEAPSSTVPLPPQSAQANVAPSGHAVAPPVNVRLRGPTEASDNALVLAALVVGLALIAAALVVLVIVAIRGGRRYRRRRAPDPRRRAEGAWHETLDVLWEHGTGGLRSLTNSEVVEEVSGLFGPEAAAQVAVVALIANAALFCVGSEVRDADAGEAWVSVDRLRRTLRRAEPVARRARNLLRVAPQRRARTRQSGPRPHRRAALRPSPSESLVRGSGRSEEQKASQGTSAR